MSGSIPYALDLCYFRNKAKASERGPTKDKRIAGVTGEEILTLKQMPREFTISTEVSHAYPSDKTTNIIPLAVSSEFRASPKARVVQGDILRLIQSRNSPRY